MLTLHPQSAMEHLHHRFVAADGSRQRWGHRLRGDRGLLDGARPDARAGPAIGAARRGARSIADPARRQRPGGRRRGECRGRERPDRRRRRRGAARRLAPGPDAAAQADLSASHAACLPPRDAAPGRARRPRPGRGRSAVSGSACTPSVAPGRPRMRSAPSTPASGRWRPPGRTWPRSAVPGIDLVADDPEQALELLTDAYQQIEIAESGNVSASRRRAVAAAGGRRASIGCTG